MTISQGRKIFPQPTHGIEPTAMRQAAARFVTSLRTAVMTNPAKTGRRDLHIGPSHGQVKAGLQGGSFGVLA